MHGRDHRQHGRAPTARTQPRGELDVFVVGEEALVEEPLADRGTAVERGRRGDAPGHRQRRTDRIAVADLPKRAVADVDARAVDAAIRPGDDRLHGGQLLIAVKRVAHLLQPVRLQHDVVVHERHVRRGRMTQGRVRAAGEAEVRFAAATSSRRSAVGGRQEMWEPLSKMMIRAGTLCARIEARHSSSIAPPSTSSTMTSIMRDLGDRESRPSP